MQQETRTEHDSLGEVSVPLDALYGAQTQRAVENFPISGQPMPATFISALLEVKLAAARANIALGDLPQDIGAAIVTAIEQLQSDADLMRHFPVDIYQTGSGTSTNMNANEVIANLASQLSGCDVSPNDHVNCGQSSNDVIPTTLHVSTALQIHRHLIPALAHLVEIIGERRQDIGYYVKTGRTHLMDAMPVTFSQVLGAWAGQFSEARTAIEAQLPALTQLAQGGTAVGTGVNANAAFAQRFAAQLSEQTGIGFSPAANPFNRIGSQDVSVMLSGQLKALAVAQMKLANDLRWMNAGPLSGLSEIALPALQPGSSIMPGKVNPVIPEAAAMVSAQVIGNDATITVAGQSGNFELNVMLPVIARNLLESIALLSNSLRVLADKAIVGFTVNPSKIEEALASNPILVTALNPVIGYRKAAEIAKTAYREKRPVLEVALEMTDIPREELTVLLDPARLTNDGD
ncbi:class II fumarate hydratase [Granulosicoccaceae sp. 1_MG-2023]|nr:class II fumarate hydratase [Granulosicoccaceae sp. 1_MG-2023]